MKNASIEKHQSTFVNNGIPEVSHLEDVTEEDAVSLGLTKYEARRLVRFYADYETKLNDESRRGSETSQVKPKAVYKTSSSSLVISLPTAMKNSVHTRDGMGNVVVNSQSLKRQFSNLWYESPACPRQALSNSFILQMASECFRFSKSLRDCESWCRKERSQRVALLFGNVKGATLDNNWTPHLKKRSAYGQVEIMKMRYPEIVSFKENDKLPGKKHYHHLCKFVEGCQDALSLARKNIEICQQEIEKTVKKHQKWKDNQRRY